MTVDTSSSGERAIWIREAALTLVGVLVIVGLLVASPHAQRTSGPEVLPVEAELYSLANRLVGRRMEWRGVPPRELKHGADPSDSPPIHRLLRIIDLDRCPNCLLDVAQWNEAVADSRLAGTILLNGGPEREINLRIRALRNTHVEYLDLRQAISGLGLLPDTYLLLGPDGTILMLHGQRTASECAWSFPAQVAALVGSAPPGYIRPSAAADEILTLNSTGR